MCTFALTVTEPPCWTDPVEVPIDEMCRSGWPSTVKVRSEKFEDELRIIMAVLFAVERSVSLRVRIHPM